MNLMKLILSFSLAAAVLTSCKEEDEKYATFTAPHWAVDMNGYVEAPHWAVDGTGSDQKPDWKIDLSDKAEAPSWEMVENNEYQYSMTAILRLTDFLERYENPNDRLAAFIGNECRGVANAEPVNGKTLYFLYIKGNNGDRPVTLKYYSATNKRIYELSDVYNFTQNAVHGTATEPDVIAFEQDTKFADSMSAVVGLSGDLAGTAADGDVLAAFCGTECRGVGEKFVSNNGQSLYRIDIRGVESSNEEISIKYYSVKNALVYKSTDRINFKNGGAYGTESQAAQPEFLPESSMTAVVVIPEELQSGVSAEDEVAAFIGDECAAAGVLTQLPNGKSAYTLTIRKDNNQSNDIAFRYYNARSSYLYITDPVTKFMSESTFGTLEAPEVLPITMKGKYPLKMTAYLCLPENLAAYADGLDELAAFAGEECRGVAVPQTNSKGGIVYAISIIGNPDTQDIVFRYYSGRNAYLYQSDAAITFEADKNYGTEEAPIMLNLYNMQ